MNHAMHIVEWFAKMQDVIALRYGHTEQSAANMAQKERQHWLRPELYAKL